MANTMRTIIYDISKEGSGKNHLNNLSVTDEWINV